MARSSLSWAALQDFRRRAAARRRTKAAWERWARPCCTTSIRRGESWASRACSWTHSPGNTREREPEADQPEIVLISGYAGEQCVGTATAPPLARQGEQTAAQQRAGEVLLRDRCLSLRPALAELVEVGKDRVP